MVITQTEVKNKEDNNMEQEKFNPYLGRTYSKEEVQQAMNNCSVDHFKYTEDYLAQAAQLIADGNIVSWFQGGSEIGPRALGHRSILADPRRKDMKDIINSRVKFREGFRPFAPSVLWEHQKEYFDLDLPNPYMLMACDILKDKQEIIPSVTHVDGTGRVQTVMRDLAPDFYDLIQEFYKITNVPVVLNTSFNIKGEPIVETPEDAIKCFLNTGIDYLVIDKFILSKQ